MAHRPVWPGFSFQWAFLIARGLLPVSKKSSSIPSRQIQCAGAWRVADVRAVASFHIRGEPPTRYRSSRRTALASRLMSDLLCMCFCVCAESCPRVLMKLLVGPSVMRLLLTKADSKALDEFLSLSRPS